MNVCAVMSMNCGNYNIALPSDNVKTYELERKILVWSGK